MAFHAWSIRYIRTGHTYSIIIAVYEVPILLVVPLIQCKIALKAHSRYATLALTAFTSLLWSHPCHAALHVFVGLSYFVLSLIQKRNTVTSNAEYSNGTANFIHLKYTDKTKTCCPPPPPHTPHTRVYIAIDLELASSSMCYIQGS